VRKNRKDDYDKLSLPTGSSFIEDILKASSRTDAVSAPIFHNVPFGENGGSWH
jgi:hypothetical protein